MATKPDKQLSALLELERRIKSGDPSVASLPPEKVAMINKRLQVYRDQGIAKPLGGDQAPEKPYSQSALDSFDRAIATAKRLKTHPGFEAGVGMPAINANPLDLFGAMEGNLAGYIVPGSKAADFRTELDTMKAQVFLPMVQSMRGMGQLSNAEGSKLTAAIGNLDPSQSEAQFQQSLDRIMADLQFYHDRASGAKSAPPPSNAPAHGKGGGDDVDAILRKHGVIK